MNAASDGRRAGRRAAAPGRRRLPRHDPGGGRAPGHLARHLRRERRPPSSPRSTRWSATCTPCATGWPPRTARRCSTCCRRASAARRNLPARVVRPDHLAELRIPVPDRAGVLAEITSLAADARHRHLRHRDRPLGRGPARRAHPGGRRRRRRRPCAAAVEAHGLPLPGRAAVVTAPRILVVDGGVPCRGHGPHAGREVDLAPRRAARRARRGHLGHPRALRRRRRRGLRWPRSRPWAPAVERRTDGQRRAARGPEPAAPPGRPARLRQLGHVHAAAGRPGGRVRLGDRAGRRRVALDAADGPGGRAPRPHGRDGRGPRRSAACRRSRVTGRLAARHRLDVQGGQRPGEVGHPPRRALGRGRPRSCARP